MSDGCAYRLGSYEPIVEASLHVQYHAGRWSLSVRHRHHSGVWRDCELDSYTMLSWREVLDLIEATTAEYGTPSGL